MKRIPVHLRVWFIVVLPVLSLPLFFLQLIIIKKTDLAETVGLERQIPFYLVSIVIALLSYWVGRGRNWAFELLRILLFSWTVLTMSVALYYRNFWMGILGIVIGVFSLIIAWLLKRELGRACLNWEKTWYEFQPQGIPRLECEMVTDRDQFRGKVSRLDSHGAFLILFYPLLPDNWADRVRGKVSRVVLDAGEKKISVSGRAVKVFRKFGGVGVRFTDLTLDDSKEVNDFIEDLRGKGYVL